MDVRGQKRHIASAADISDICDPVKSMRRDNRGIIINIESTQNGCEGVDENIVEKTNRTLKRDDSGYSSTSDIEDEDDVIHPCDVNVKCENEPPSSIKGHDDWSKAQTKVSDKRSRLRTLQSMWNVGQFMILMFASCLHVRVIYTPLQPTFI